MPALARRLWLTLLGVCLVGLASASAQMTETPARLTLHPAMVKGAPTAPVTIVEFSDYQ